MPDPAELVREQSHRLPRTCYRGEVAVAFTARLTTGSEPLARPEMVRAMETALAASARRHTCIVPLYCFMPDHIHLILQGMDGSADTWAAMTAFKQRSGFWFARHRLRMRWQKDFYDHVLRSEKEVRDALAYIAANPLRAGLVRDPAEYPCTGSIGHEPAGSRDR